MIRIDVVPKIFFNAAADKLIGEAFNTSNQLQFNCALEEISPALAISEKTIINGVNKEFNTAIQTIDEASEIWNETRYLRLRHLIDTKFTDEKLIELLDHFEKREDDTIRGMVTDNADIPTIFEYILGIIWYKVSEKQGRILEYMKLSLDADLLPKTHAAGGEADIVYEYEETSYYPKHSLLLEATLADKTSQRKMEMEPVSRHLGLHIIRASDTRAYCVFTTNFLDSNVISDFRGRKSYVFYDPQDRTKSFRGMKIIPLETKDLQQIIKQGKRYKELYTLFDDAYNVPIELHDPVEWYETHLQNAINNSQ